MIRDKYNLVKHGPCEEFVSLAVDEVNKVIANIDKNGTLNVIFPDKTIIQLQTEPIGHVTISLNYLIGFGYTCCYWWKVNQDERKLKHCNQMEYSKHNIEGPITSISSWFKLSDDVLGDVCFVMDSNATLFLMGLNDEIYQITRLTLDSQQICHNNFQVRLLTYTNPVARLLIFDYEAILSFDVTITVTPLSSNITTNNNSAIYQITTSVQSNVLKFPVEQFQENHNTNAFSNVTVQDKGKNIIVSADDGRYFCFSVLQNRFVNMNDRFPYGPFPCQTIGKVISGLINGLRHPVAIFNYGLPEVTYRNTNSLTVAINGESEICLLFHDRIVDFQVTYDDEVPQRIDEIIVMTTSQLISLSYNGSVWSHFNFFPVSSPVMSRIIYMSDIIHIPQYDDSFKNAALFSTRDDDNRMVVWWFKTDQCFEKIAEIDMNLVVSCLKDEVIEEKKPLWPRFQKCGLWSTSPSSSVFQKLYDSKLEYDESTGCLTLSILTRDSNRDAETNQVMTYLYRFLIDHDPRLSQNLLLDGQETAWNYPCYELEFGENVAIKVKSERKVVNDTWSKFKLLSVYKWNVYPDKPDLNPSIDNLNSVFMTANQLLLILNNFVYLFDVVNMTASNFCFKERISYGKKLRTLFKKSSRNNLKLNSSIDSTSETKRNPKILLVNQSESNMKIIYCDWLMDMYLLKFDLIESEDDCKSWTLKSTKTRHLSKSVKRTSKENGVVEEDVVLKDKLVHLSMIKEEWYKHRQLSIKSNGSNSLRNSSTLPSPSISSVHSSISRNSKRSLLVRSENLKILFANQMKLKLLDGNTLRTESKFNVHIPATSMNGSVSIGRISEPIKINQLEYNKHRYSNPSSDPSVTNNASHCITAVLLNNSDHILIISLPKLNVLELLTRDPLLSERHTNLLITNCSILIGCINNQSKLMSNQVVENNRNLNESSSLILQSHFESHNNDSMKNGGVMEPNVRNSTFPYENLYSTL